MPATRCPVRVVNFIAQANTTVTLNTANPTVSVFYREDDGTYNAAVFVQITRNNTTLMVDHGGTAMTGKIVLSEPA